MLMKLLPAFLAAFLLSPAPALLAQDSPKTSATAAPPAESATGDSPDTDELSAILREVENHHIGALARYRAWHKAVGDDEERASDGSSFDAADSKALSSLEAFADIVHKAETISAEALSNPDYDNKLFHDLVREAIRMDNRENSLAVESVELVSRAWKDADALVKIRDDLFDRYQDEAETGKITAGTRLAWILIRVGASGPDVRIRPGSFVFDDKCAEIALDYKGHAISVKAETGDYRQRIRATVDGYRFRTGWAVLLQKPVTWLAAMAEAMKDAGIDADYQREWDVMEAPEGLIALGAASGKRWDVPMRAFYRGAVFPVDPLPAPEHPARVVAQFRTAARKLSVGVANDATIPAQLRQALKPVLEGTYKPVDPRDYFDNDFCRRLIEADYLESQVEGLSEERLAELAEYRTALAKLELGLDRFAIDMGGDGRLVAVTRPNLDVADGTQEEDYADPETGETVSRYHWRWERDEETVFHSPLPSRYLYALSLMEHYDGKHTSKPAGNPRLTQVWHAVLGRLASYRDGDDKATGDADAWQRAVVLDARGRKDTTAGPLGWNFPFFVPVRNDQGDPVLIATERGVVESPDFSGVADEAERRREQDAWLDTAARVLATPGELALLYQVFFRYCSDSPLPEQPNLIGSHYALSDTHQTVYQSLDRRWVGRLIGDCDDLAEFFQNLCVRQGKLGHVMQLPAHAAAGYLDEAPEGGYEFIVLQTGPVLRFTADTRIEAIEMAYRYFDDGNESHFTAAAVPLLLRFGGEDTRTAFVLPARIYWDGPYAEKMIAVQEYWHLHTFSAAIKTMEGMLREDREEDRVEAGNLKELASLYERVGEYDKADALRREELQATGDDTLETLSTLLDLAQLHVKEKNKTKAMEDLSRMEAMSRDWRESDTKMYERTASFRYSCAALLSRLNETDQAWELMRPDVEAALDKGSALSDAVLRTLVTIYNRMAILRDDESVAGASTAEAEARRSLGSVLAKAFGKGYFKKDDSNNKLHTRYFWLGRYAVAVAGRKAGLESLWRDGPYPTEPRAHADRDSDLSEADWEWFRIMPRPYLAYGAEMLDRDDYPELYDPAGAKKCLGLVERAMTEGAGFGSDVMGRDSLVKSDAILSFLNRDLPAFKQVMALVRGRDYSSLYDDAAVVFGAYCGLVPEDEFAAWIDAFHEFFPGRQHYFKAAYGALDKGHFRHAEMLAAATAGFFPDDALFGAEAVALKESAERIRRFRSERGWNEVEWTSRREDGDASSWRRDLVEAAVLEP